MSEKETYEQVVEYVWQRREIEFVYNDKRYAFLSSQDGFVLVCENKRQGAVFKDYEQMIHDSKMDGQTFLELFKNGKVTITAVL